MKDQTLPLGLREDSPHIANSRFREAVYALASESLEEIIYSVIKKEHLSPRIAMFSRVTFLRFCSLKFISNQILVPPPLTDTFWHNFILHTRDYTEFCQRHFGSYMHHAPFPRSEVDWKGAYSITLDLIEECYGNVDHLRRPLLKK